jgi:cell division septal protein FtsQ
MRKLLTVVAVIVVAGVLTWLVVFSQVFVVRHVEVSGTALLTSDQVLAAADISGTTQMVRLDSAGVIDRVAALPQVASVEVRRVPFDRVQIVVTERVAVAVLAGGAGFQLIDATGTSFVTCTPESLAFVGAAAGGETQVLAHRPAAHAFYAALGVPELTDADALARLVLLGVDQ